MDLKYCLTLDRSTKIWNLVCDDLSLNWRFTLSNSIFISSSFLNEKCKKVFGPVDANNDVL